MLCDVVARHRFHHLESAYQLGLGNNISEIDACTFDDPIEQKIALDSQAGRHMIRAGSRMRCPMRERRRNVSHRFAMRGMRHGTPQYALLAHIARIRSGGAKLSLRACGQ